MDRDDSYRALGSAVVIQAIVDYRTAARKLRELENGNPYKGSNGNYFYQNALKNARETIAEVDEFFRSEWCYELCHRAYGDIISLVSDIDDMHIEEVIISNREKQSASYKS